MYYVYFYSDASHSLAETLLEALEGKLKFIESTLKKAMGKEIKRNRSIYPNYFVEIFKVGEEVDFYWSHSLYEGTKNEHRHYELHCEMVNDRREYPLEDDSPYLLRVRNRNNKVRCDQDWGRNLKLSHRLNSHLRKGDTLLGINKLDKLYNSVITRDCEYLSDYDSLQEFLDMWHIEEHIIDERKQLVTYADLI